MALQQPSSNNSTMRCRRRLFLWTSTATITDVSSVEFSGPNARALGIVPDIPDPNSVPLGQGDAGIGFNSAFQFDFNPDDGVSTGPDGF